MKKQINLSLWLKQAADFHQKGKLREAEALYRKTLEIKDDYAQAWYLLGILKWNQNRLEKAEEYLKKAIELDTANADFQRKLAEFYQKTGRAEKGIELLNKLIASGEQTAKNTIALGKMLRNSGNLKGAKKNFEKALQADTNNANALNHLGNIASLEQNWTEAVIYYRKVIQLKPNLPQPYLNLGIAIGMQQKHQEALQAFQKALSLKPDWTEPYERAIQLLMAMKDWANALQATQKAIKTHPDHIPFYELLAGIYGNLKNYHQVAKIAQSILSKQPNNAEANYQYGVVLAENGRTEEAINYFQKAYDNPNPPQQAGFYLGKAHRDLGNYEKCQQIFENLASKYPRFFAVQHELALLQSMLCDWAKPNHKSVDMEALIEKQITAEGQQGGFIPVLSLNYFGLGNELRQRAAKHTSKSLEHQVKYFSSQQAFNFSDRKKKDKIRLGYYSPDFRNHAVGSLIQNLFRDHDKSKFEVFAYSLTTPQHDEIQEKMKADADKFVDVSNQPYHKIAQQIYDDEIDILIDLGGYTTYTKTEVVALRPAPIQIQYMGLLDTMGANFIDYTIADAFVVPSEIEAFYTEKVMHLSQAFITAELPISNKASVKSDWGLPETGFVFACFNASYKINQAVFTAWVNILRSVPDSVLWLVQENELVIKNLTAEAERQGISASRLIFSKKVKLPEHLERSQHADLFLDTFCFNAGAVAVGSLQAGLPILTLAGQSYASRIGGSLVSYMGLDDFVTQSEEAYVEKAIELAQNPKLLQQAQHTLEKNRHLLTNSQQRVREIEDIFERLMSEKKTNT